MAVHFGRHQFEAKPIFGVSDWAIGIAMVLALNYWDSAKKRRIDIDLAELRSRLGVPVVPISASIRKGLPSLKKPSLKLWLVTHLRTPDWPDSVIEALDEMRAVLPSESLEQLDEAALLRSLFEGNEERLLRSGASETQVAEALDSGKKVLFKGGLNPATVEAVLLYRHIKTIIDSSIKHDALSQTRASRLIAC